MPDFFCKIYDNQPKTCREYPWKNAQIIFSECIFVKNNKVIQYKNIVKDHSSKISTEKKCRQCGMCCFVWEKHDENYIRIGKCKFLQMDVATEAKFSEIPIHVRR